jgi:hypothetical protein
LWPEWFQAPRQLAAWWLNYLNIAVAEFFEHFSPSLAELFERRHGAALEVIPVAVRVHGIRPAA